MGDGFGSDRHDAASHPAPASEVLAGPEERGAADPLVLRLDQLRRQLPAGTRLLAVSKGQPAALIRRAAGYGQRSFAESRLQEAQAKQEALADLPGLDWHFIGRLQANKARAVLRRFATIHSVDSLELAERLARIAAEESLSPALFLQVKLRSDPAKAGFSPESLRQAWPRLRALAPLRPLGLMTIAPLGLASAERSALFADCAALARELGLAELSMGMSDDWREAAAAGSTWVRLGSALFGARPPLG
jgi:pyridoxal phosphate enzyme (YggS family)